MSLLTLQRDFRAWLSSEDAALATHLGRNPRAGLSVYQNNYRAQLVAFLEEGFAHTRAWIGQGAFLTAAATYIDAIPPSSWTIDAYGRDFPAMLALLHPHDPEVAELAWLEQALSEAFVGPDAPTITATDAVDVDWDRAVLHFTPTLDHRDAITNATAIWAALNASEVPPAVESLAEPATILVWRDGQVSRFRTIDQREMQAILWARGGMAFPDLCAALVEAWGESEGIALAGRYLGQWIGDGLISAITAEFMENI